MAYVVQYLKAFYDIYLDIAPLMVLGLFFVGILHVFFSKDFVIKHIGKDNLASIVKSSVVGVPLPLCSCGVIPTAVYMSKNGASRGAVVSFLISTPQTGIDSIIATYGMMGWIFAIYRPIIAFISGIVGGIIVNIFSTEKDIFTGKSASGKRAEAPTCTSHSCSHSHKEKKETTFGKFYNYAFKEFLDDITVQFLVGVALAALITILIPNDFFTANGLFSSGLGAMFLMVIIGIPMYVCATASIPIAVSLMLKGISPGAALVFLAVGPLTNIASLAILTSVFSKKIIAIFLGTVILLAILSGILFDWILDLTNLSFTDISPIAHEHSVYMDYFQKGTSLIFTMFVVLSLIRIVQAKMKKA